MTFREFTGKNVEEAIRSAMKEYSAELSELDIEILSQGSRGILGVGGEEARILAAPKSAVAAAETVRDTAPEPAEAPAREPRRASAPPPPVEMESMSETMSEPMSEQVADLGRADAPPRRDGGGRSRGGRGRSDRDARGGRGDRPFRDRPPREPREDRPPREPAPFIPGKPLEELTEKERGTLGEAKGVLEELLRLMEVPGTVEVATGGETARLNVRGSDLGVLIGRRGEKLASLQHIVNLIVAKKEGEYHRIAVDVENYRGRREEQLRDVADRAAKRVAADRQDHPARADARHRASDRPHGAGRERQGAHPERRRRAEPPDRDPAGNEGRIAGTNGMQRDPEPLAGARAIGRLEAGGPWVGFGYRAGEARFVVEDPSGVLDRPADGDLLLALAIAYFADAAGDAPPDLEATQSDLSSLVRRLMDSEAEAGRRALLHEAIDAIDDGLAGDAVAAKLEAARSPRGDAVDPVDPVELLVRKAAEVAAGG